MRASWGPSDAAVVLPSFIESFEDVCPCPGMLTPFWSRLCSSLKGGSVKLSGRALVVSPTDGRTDTIPTVWRQPVWIPRNTGRATRSLRRSMQSMRVRSRRKGDVECPAKVPRSPHTFTFSHLTPAHNHDARVAIRQTLAATLRSPLVFGARSQ